MIFWAVVFPRYKRLIFILTALLFVYWKSEYASGLIEVVNRVFHIRRTVDPTDLLALPFVLLAWLYTNGNEQKPLGKALVARLSLMFVGVVTFFAFCATSQQRYFQSFDQPQYVLLLAKAGLDSSANYEFDFYKKDSLLVVKVNQISTSKPVRHDDFNKNLSINELDKYVVSSNPDSLSLIPSEKRNSFSVVTPEGTDSLMFKGGRLDGRFSRTKNGNRILEGNYSNGLEVGEWRSWENDEMVVQTFVFGERTEVKRYSHGKLHSSKTINTRADTIKIKYIHLGILFLCVVAVIILLVRNYRKIAPQQLQLKIIWKWLLCFVFPFFVWLAYSGIQLLLMDYDSDFFAVLASIFFIFLLVCPLMVVVVFLIKLRKEVDILLYCLFFALLCNTWTTYGTIIELSS